MLVLGHVLFHSVRQVLLGGFRVPNAVQQECAAVLQPFQQVVLAEVRRNVAGYEIRRIDQVGRTDRLVAETQVRCRIAARLFRVVGEVGLAVFVGRVADDFNRVLVGSNGTVGAQADETGLERIFVFEVQFRAYRQRGERYVVHDAYREVILRLVGLQVFVNGQHLRRGGVFRRQPVAAAYDDRRVCGAVQHVFDVEVERFAVGARFLGTVEHADSFYRFRQYVHQVFRRERTVEMYRDQAGLFAFRLHVVDRLLDRFGDRTHRDYDVFGVRIAVISERFVFPAGDFADVLHGLGHQIGDGVVEAVRRFAGLEIDVGVLGRAARYRVLRIQRPFAELGQRFGVE